MSPCDFSAAASSGLTGRDDMAMSALPSIKLVNPVPLPCATIWMPIGRLSPAMSPTTIMATAATARSAQR
jgi:hypothetical protein